MARRRMREVKRPEEPRLALLAGLKFSAETAEN